MIVTVSGVFCTEVLHDLAFILRLASVKNALDAAACCVELQPATASWRAVHVRNSLGFPWSQDALQPGCQAGTARRRALPGGVHCRAAKRAEHHSLPQRHRCHTQHILSMVELTRLNRGLSFNRLSCPSC
jgi:hypothetical protein